jgi:predicted DNA-binding transcriptional regulator AlpA
MSAMPRDELELLDAKQIAELFRVPLSWVQQSVRARCKTPMPYIKIGHYVRFEESAVREWLEGRKRGYSPKRKHGK